MKEPIREFGGKILGYREDQGNKIVATNFTGQILGYYDKELGITSKFGGQFIANGDITAALIMDANK